MPDESFVWGEEGVKEESVSGEVNIANHHNAPTIRSNYAMTYLNIAPRLSASITSGVI